ncbi:MAG: phage terminase small subunit, partial [Comamonas sp.]
MNLSPAQRHLARIKAEQQAAQAAADSPHGRMIGGQHELMMAQLHAHLRTLKDIQSVERKIEAKRKMLVDFEDYVIGVLDADGGAQDPLIATMLVWHLDVGEWPRAITLAEYCLRHGLVLPDQYKRNLPTMLLDEVADAAI